MTTKHVGLYPGTFDPITKGHIDIITRGCRVLDKLVIAVAKNDRKGPLFNTQERVDMVLHDIAPLREQGHEIEVLPFDNLLVHFAREVGASIIIRGLRAVSDFEYEFQMTGMNARLDAEIETVFLMASEKQQFISSRFVKEIGYLGGDIASFVSPETKIKLEKKFKLMRDNKI
ncbi:pantetheine-phosphate adenylyltransferase [Kiloniella laminariae]|uniref:pantetheine-phosphate adenylyltransferase n=1 Tax=Kiloniella laminariae TaxID=454162 RepID=UPI0003715984|nr:pantetheine-phosphate adenylyltransferase [Kiloniella laminariae]